MKKLINYGLVIALVIAIPLASGCRKDKENDDADTQAAEDQSLAESYFNDLKSISDEASDGSLSSFKGGSMLSASCATISHDTISVPRKIIIDFGAANCLCKDGRNRRGVLNVSYTGKYRDSGTVVTVTPTDFYVNDHKITGYKSFTNKGRNSKGNLNYDINVNGQILKPGGGTVSWQSTRNNEWSAGESTRFNWLDDVYLVTGNASGSNSNGVSWSANVTSPLRVQIGCRWITAGGFDLLITGKATRSIDYGSGACDNDANVTINSKVYPIKLK